MERLAEPLSQQLYELITSLAPSQEAIGSALIALANTSAMVMVSSGLKDKQLLGLRKAFIKELDNMIKIYKELPPSRNDGIDTLH